MWELSSSGRSDEPPSDLRYCPRCAGPLELRSFEDQGQHPACLGCGYVLWQNLKPCVDALVVRHAETKPEVLLGRRTTEPARGKWDTPGGFLNVGDTPEGRLALACPPEVGISVRVRELLGAFADQFGEVPVITLYYWCDPEHGEPQPGKVVDDVRWFPLSDPPTLAFAATSSALVALRARLQEPR